MTPTTFLEETMMEFDEMIALGKHSDLEVARIRSFYRTQTIALIEKIAGEVERMKGTKYKNTVYEMVWNEGISAAVEVVNRLNK